MVNILSARAVPLTTAEIGRGLEAVTDIRRRHFSRNNPVRDLYNQSSERERKALCLLARLSERHINMKFEEMNEREREQLIEGMIVMRTLTEHFPPRLLHSYKVLEDK
ncbi:hypothetical protein [Limnobaculum xujianqingii]|uniref:hypothetical protein n=1 Tax=Limnobaculum xujianqingii TaxID=2738837 RepID=UPI001129CD66|nr:hypothetical protein [Limnobaculum xujianqingii]